MTLRSGREVITGLDTPNYDTLVRCSSVPSNLNFDEFPEPEQLSIRSVPCTSRDPDISIPCSKKKQEKGKKFTSKFALSQEEQELLDEQEVARSFAAVRETPPHNTLPTGDVIYPMQSFQMVNSSFPLRVAADVISESSGIMNENSVDENDWLRSYTDAELPMAQIPRRVSMTVESNYSSAFQINSTRTCRLTKSAVDELYELLTEVNSLPGAVIFCPPGSGKSTVRRYLRRRKFACFEAKEFPADYQDPASLQKFADAGMLILTNRTTHCTNRAIAFKTSRYRCETALLRRHFKNQQQRQREIRGILNLFSKCTVYDMRNRYLADMLNASSFVLPPYRPGLRRGPLTRDVFLRPGPRPPAERLRRLSVRLERM